MTEKITVKKDNSERAIKSNKRQIIIWVSALIIGALLGLLQLHWLNELMTFIATVFTRLFQLIAASTSTRQWRL